MKVGYTWFIDFMGNYFELFINPNILTAVRNLEKIPNYKIENSFMIKKIIKVNTSLDPQTYVNFLQDIEHHIHQSQVEAFTAINFALNMRNWVLGKLITEKQEEHAWGSDFIDLLAKDLQKMFPGNHGFSLANIYRMVAFYQCYRNIRTAVRNLQEQPIFMIPWGHNVVIMQKVKNQEENLWYAQQSMEFGWSRSTLEVQIKKDLYHRQAKVISNFHQTLPSQRAAITQQSFKDPYVFDFLTLDDNHREQDLELGLMSEAQKLLLEMGKGFALIGRQYHIQVGGEDYYIDLLFYHAKLKCYVVVELKAREFEPKDAGQLNFYLSAVDDLERDDQDNPTIGLLLCKSKNNFTAEYALRGINRPIGVSEYATELMKKLEKQFESNLPTIEELEAEFAKIDAMHHAKAASKTKKIVTKKIKA